MKTNMMKTILVLSLTIFTVGCIQNQAKIHVSPTEWKNIMTKEEQANWQLTPWRPNVKTWVMKDGIYRGNCGGGWVGHAYVFQDFIVEFDFNHDGKGGGNVILRGNRDVKRTWESGYSLSMFPSDDGKTGLLKLAIWPDGVKAGPIEYPFDQWNSVRAEVIGSTIAIDLNGKRVMQFSDPEQRFKSGQLCLEDHPCEPEKGECDLVGHVLYRNMKVLGEPNH